MNELIPVISFEFFINHQYNKSYIVTFYKSIL